MLSDLLNSTTQDVGSPLPSYHVSHVHKAAHAQWAMHAANKSETCGTSLVELCKLYIGMSWAISLLLLATVSLCTSVVAGGELSNNINLHNIDVFCGFSVQRAGGNGVPSRPQEAVEDSVLLPSLQDTANEGGISVL